MKQRISHDQNSATEKRQRKGTEWNREDSKTLFELFKDFLRVTSTFFQIFSPPRATQKRCRLRRRVDNLGNTVVFVHCCRAQTNAWLMRSLFKGVGQTPGDCHARPQVKQLDCRVANTVSISKKCDLSYNK